jgi:hypothetical protein
LSRYIKKEGFYNLEEAHPWGLLFLFHFEKGKFIGEALTPRDAVPDGVFAGRDYGAAGWGGPEPSEGERLCTFDDVYYREICFVGDFDSEGALSSGTLLGEVDNKEYVCKVSPRGEQREHLHAASSSIVNVLSERAQRLGVDFWRDRAGQKISQASEPARQGLCLSEHEHGSDLESKKGITVRQREDTASRARARALAFQPRIPIYGKDLLKAVWDDKKHLEFNFVEGPKRSSFKYYEGMPIIRPGLYVGQYGSAEQYGKFASECLLIEYKTFSIVTPSAWDEIKKQVFRGGDQSDDTNIFNSIRAAVDQTNVKEVMFVLGRKVTGDINVFAGEVTFGALVHPSIAPEAMEGKCVRSKERNDRATYKVVRCFKGFGTLAYPGFRAPSWSKGDLVELKKSDECSSDHNSSGNSYHQIGFLWGRDEQTTVLKYVPLQQQFPWFDER